MKPESGSNIYGVWLVLNIAAASVAVVVLLPLKHTPIWPKVQWYYFGVQTRLAIWGDARKLKRERRALQVLGRLP